MKLLINTITPQKPQLNRGVWLDLERYERSLSRGDK